MALKIAINGFGRIGRLVCRIATQRGGIEIVGVNDLVPADNLAYLLKYDSTHGRFAADVRADGESIVVNGKVTQCTAIKDPTQLPWKAMGVDYVLESTGLFTTAEDAGKHITAGARRVLISAPTKRRKCQRLCMASIPTTTTRARTRFSATQVAQRIASRPSSKCCSIIAASMKVS